MSFFFFFNEYCQIILSSSKLQFWTFGLGIKEKSFNHVKATVEGSKAEPGISCENALENEMVHFQYSSFTSGQLLLCP